MLELSSSQLGLETWMLAGGSVCPGERVFCCRIQEQKGLKVA